MEEGLAVGARTHLSTLTISNLTPCSGMALVRKAAPMVDSWRVKGEREEEGG